MASDRKRVLVLCPGNSRRSQMAEGWINHLLEGQREARSAGTAPAARVHPFAVRALAEAGVDIGRAKPQQVGLHLDQPWDLVVTVCDSAQETCPAFPRAVANIPF
ncbi:MAG TPA: arsenate reductase ArsC [Vicinamibacteria bacterium]|nr:arsenate reductase ArsC [Vicinamibacteria bacterium]